MDRRGRRRDRLAAVPGLYAAAVLAAVLLFAAGAAVATSVQGHAASDPVIVAAGDICGSATDCAPTATLIDQINPDRVLTLGDNAYEDGTLAQYNAYYAPNWGRFLDKTAPSPGNHEYHTANAQGYFSYFGAKAPGPYYSYDVGSWHLISLTGDISVSAGSAQETWLKADLAAHPSQCTLAYWHEPRFSSGTTHGSSSSFDQFWRDLYAAGADIILNGHEHNYERFAPQSPGATADPKGIREFVVGTGGVSHGYSFGTPIANSEVRNSTTWGVIKLTLHSGSYDWQFVPVAGGVFTDSGSGSCSGAAPPRATALAYTGDTTADYHDPATLSAVLTDPATSLPVPGATITFTLGTQTCAATTDVTGRAACVITLNQVPGNYTVTASYGGNGLLLPSNASSPFTITREETTLTYTGDTLIANGTTAHLAGVLEEDGTVPIAGRTVTFTLGSGGGAQTCSGVTDASGTASCNISPVAQPLGPGTVTADFAGDVFYLPSSDTKATLIFAFLASGGFVVGDGSAAGAVTFWSAQWAALNTLSGGPAPPSFKGFAETLSSSPPTCGGSWSTRPGNSSGPPANVPSFMGVLVSSAVTKTGPTISGDIRRIIVVNTDSGYGPNPGHAGTGTVVAEVCHL